MLLTIRLKGNHQYPQVESVSWGPQTHVPTRETVLDRKIGGNNFRSFVICALRHATGAGSHARDFCDEARLLYNALSHTSAENLAEYYPWAAEWVGTGIFDILRATADSLQGKGVEFLIPRTDVVATHDGKRVEHDELVRLARVGFFDDDVEALLRMAAGFDGNGESLLAARLLASLQRNVQPADPRWIDICTTEAKYLSNAGEHDHAMQVLDEMVEKRPNDRFDPTRAFIRGDQFQRGIALRRLKRFAEAQQQFKKILQLDALRREKRDTSLEEPAWSAKQQLASLVVEEFRHIGAKLSDEHWTEKLTQAAADHEACAAYFMDRRQDVRRAGYSWRRLTEIHTILGDTEKAKRYAQLTAEAHKDYPRELDWFQDRLGGL